MGVREDVERIRDPRQIREAMYASSAYVLVRAFSRDPTLAALVKAGPAATAAIAEVVKREGLALGEVTLSAYAYVISQADPGALPTVFGPVFRKAAERPGLFFVHVVAQALEREKAPGAPWGDHFYLEPELRRLAERLPGGE